MNPAPTEIPSAPQVSSAPPPPSSYRKLFIIIGLIFIFLISVSGAFFLGKSQNNQNTSMTSSPPPLPSISLTKEGSPTPNPTADWKTFSNSYGYSIKLPLNIEMKNIGFDSTDPEHKPNVRFSENKNEPLQYPHMNIFVIESPKTTLEEEANKNYLANINHRSMPATPIETIRKSSFLIQPSFIYILQNKGFVNPLEEYLGFSGNYKVIWVENNGKFYMISWTQNPLFDQIISTFKFTNQAAIQNDQLKSYTNSKYSFTFQYPATGLLKELDNPSANQFNISVTNTSDDFTLDIQKMDPAYSKYYLGSQFLESQDINGITWDVIKNQGYCDAGSCGDPFIAYQTVKDNNRYVFIFNKTQETSNNQTQIIKTFKFQ